MIQSGKRFAPILLVLAALAAVAVSLTSKYNGLTLILVQKSSTAGVGKVYWDTGSGFSAANSRNYVVAASQNDDWGRYIVQLPAVGLKAVRIVPPVGTSGTVEFQQIALLGDRLQYSLLQDGRCLQQQVGARPAPAVTCSGQYPHAVINPDASVMVSALPAPLIETSPLTRGVLSLYTVIFVYCGGGWLLRRTENVSSGEAACFYLGRAAWLALGYCYLLQFYQLFRYAVDIPYIDEWLYFSRDALPEGLTWRWLFAFHNEHRIVPTKLLAWFDLKLFELDFVKQQLGNYLLYGVLIAATVKLKKTILGDSFRLFPAFLLLLLSPINYENHVWGFQSQFHLVIIFALLALNYAFENREYLKNYSLFTLFVLLAAYTFSAGVFLAVFFLVCQTVYVISTRAHHNSDASRGCRPFLVSAALIVSGLGCWFIGYQRPAHHPPFTLPFSSVFWDYFFNVLSFGFGFIRMSTLAGVVCLALVLTPLVMLWLKRASGQRSGTWKITAAILAMLAILAIISVGRAGIGEPKSSRYAEFGLLLIPFASIAWHMALSPGRVRTGLLLLFWGFCSYTLAPYWTDFFYREDRANKLLTLQCAEKYYNGSGDGNCEEEIASSIGLYLDNAARLKTKFTRQFTVRE